MTGQFTPRMVEVIWARDEGACFFCRKPLDRTYRGFDWSLHHRRPRGAGGTSRTMTTANGILLCGSGTTGCHGRFEAHRHTAEAFGIIIPLNARGWEWEPYNRPVRREDGSWWLLTVGGDAVQVERGFD